MSLAYITARNVCRDLTNLPNVVIHTVADYCDDEALLRSIRQWVLDNISGMNARDLVMSTDGDDNLIQVHNAGLMKQIRISDKFWFSEGLTRIMKAHRNFITAFEHLDERISNMVVESGMFENQRFRYNVIRIHTGGRSYKLNNAGLHTIQNVDEQIRNILSDMRDELNESLNQLTPDVREYLATRSYMQNLVLQTKLELVIGFNRHHDITVSQISVGFEDMLDKLLIGYI